MARPRGHVGRRGTRWVVVIEGPKDAITGKRRRCWYSGFRTRIEAEKARIELLRELDIKTSTIPIP